MDIICSICQCSISSDPPPGSTDLAEHYATPSGASAGSHEPWEIGKKTVTTPCGHLFHNTCLTQWFIMIGNRRCPLCNFVSPGHKIISIYPTQSSGGSMGDEPSEDCTEIQCSQQPNKASPVSAEGDTLLGETEPMDTKQDLESTSSGSTCLQATETSINGIRTLVYHFGPLRNLPSEMNGEAAIAVQSQRFRSSLGSLAFGSGQCSRCNNLSRIQALMTNDMKDLRELVSEQKSHIDNLNSVVECFKNNAQTLES